MFSLALLALQLAVDIEAAPDEALFDAGRENQSGMTFSPNGRSVFWTAWNGQWGSEGERRTIFTSHWENARWSEPAPMLFSSVYDDDDPFVSPDGRWLYFVSTRPASPDGREVAGDIWRYHLLEPHTIERLLINSDAAEYSPVVTSSGALYFASGRAGGFGQGDLYRAAAVGEQFAEPELLGPALNYPTGEWNLWVADDEREVIFEASSRATNVTVSGDLYYSWLTAAGWSPAIPIDALNSEGSDLMPRLHPDGARLYYTTAAIGGHARIETADWSLQRADLRAGFSPALLVANRSSHEVSFVDLEKGEVSHRVSTGEGPHLLSNVVGGRVLATGYGVFPKPHANPVEQRPPFVENLNSRITLIDTVGTKPILDIVLDGCMRPHASWIVGSRGFVVCEDEARVLEIDLGDGAIVSRFDTGQKGSHVLAFEPASRVLSVSNTDSGSVTLINFDDRKTEIVPLGRGSEGALVVDNRIWVANAVDGTLSIVDPVSAREVHRSDRLCGFPISMATGAGKLVWVACFGTSELVAIDRDNYGTVRRVALTAAPLHVIVHAARSLAYVSLPRENALQEVDLATGELIRRIPVGIEPDGLRWAAGNSGSE